MWTFFNAKFTLKCREIIFFICRLYKKMSTFIIISTLHKNVHTCSDHTRQKKSKTARRVWTFSFPKSLLMNFFLLFPCLIWCCEIFGVYDRFPPTSSKAEMPDTVIWHCRTAWKSGHQRFLEQAWAFLPQRVNMWSHQAKATTWVFFLNMYFFHFFTVYILSNVFCKF